MSDRVRAAFDKLRVLAAEEYAVMLILDGIVTTKYREAST